MNLEFGFLVSYDWLEALRSLGGEDFKALLLALIDRQREGVELPRFENPMVRVFASMIEPTIVRRLKGSEYGKRKGRTQNKDESLPEATHETTHETTHEDTPQGTLQPSKAKQSKAERTLAKRSLAEHSGAEGAHVRGGETTPSYAPRKETPSYAPQEETPSYAPREETPSYAPQEETPSYAPRETPSYAPQEETPSYAPQEETPSYAPRKETPSYAPQEETPSYAPREETPSLDLQAAPQVAPRQPPAPALREEREAAERSALERGVPRAYLEARIARAEHHAQQSGRRTSDLLWEWWQADRTAPMWRRMLAEEGSARQTGAAETFSSFETDDFFLAALEHSRRKIAEALAEDDAVGIENAEKL